MFNRIQNKLLGIFYNIDLFELDNNTITLKGWLFSYKHKITDICFIFEDQNGKSYSFDGLTCIRRNDVFNAFSFKNATNSGFYIAALTENCTEIKASIEYKINGKKHKIFVGTLKSSIQATDKAPRITELLSSTMGVDLNEKFDMQEKYSFSFPEKYYSECIDLIVPVYNGFRFLEPLLNSIPKTKMKYRLFIIDDKSPDKNVYPYLEQYAKGKDNVILLQNENNLGFLQTVNRGLELCENHVALINTDIELPELWLERLILPILENPEIATTTPYTTCGTICSFPHFLKDNPMFLGLSVNQIDKEFINVKPNYVEMPTGVGYCMGMNKNAIKDVGLLDEKHFGKGYGEENDWCQRAIACGYKNVQVENLFVFHNHGGSFPSEEKKKLLKEHEKQLLIKHPEYNADVARYCVLDPNKDIREWIQLKLLQKYKPGKTILAFDHMLGGGATSYLEKKKKELLLEGNNVVIVRYNYFKDLYEVQYFYDEDILKSFISVKNGIKSIIQFFNSDEIWINELVTYPNLYSVLDDIRESASKKNIPVRMLFHDYFAICPTINLIDSSEKYCGIPNCSACKECIGDNPNYVSLNMESMTKWRMEWNKFLLSCDKVVAFSNDTKQIVKRVYENLDNIVVIPHQIGYFPTIHKVSKTTNTLNVGLLGVLSHHKGELIVEKLMDLIEENNLPIKIKLIGRAEHIKPNSIFSQTGTYSRGSVPRLTLENDIDIFLIPSIWPETFSYTTEEIMKMGMPIMSFDIGAPAERIKKYEKGIIIPEMNAESVLNVLLNNQLIKEIQKLPYNDNRVLFVVDEVTYSSRYRVDHLMEQLALKGIRSDKISKKEINTVNVKRYKSVVIYRTADYKNVEVLKKKCNKNNIPLFYDIDDYIFDYDAISTLGFLKGKEYKDFSQYSHSIEKAMHYCDGYIVSTNSLAEMVSKKFPGKPVEINRNSASMEMVTISLQNPSIKHKKVTLGYFSGSNTHNADFEMITPAILEVMKNNPNVDLLVGGQIKLPKEFEDMKNRVKTFKFVDWKELPALIAEADINLMPLENTIFHTCKSENKWMEAALVGVPTIASWNKELSNVISDGVDGYLCKNSDEWIEKLELLVNDTDIRENIVASAKLKVMQSYTTETLSETLLHLLNLNNQ